MTFFELHLVLYEQGFVLENLVKRGGSHNGSIV